jgi:hypothetical protein
LLRLRDTLKDFLAQPLPVGRFPSFPRLYWRTISLAPNGRSGIVLLTIVRDTA